MPRPLTKFLALAVASYLATASARAASGVALVIGNGAYDHAQPPKTVYADADATAQTLQAAGLDVSDYHDVKQADTGAVLADFLTKVQNAGPNSVAFLYLSGYAAQYDGDNYFIPVDATIAKDSDLPTEALRVADVTDALAKLKTVASVVVIDGSRASTFAIADGSPPAPGLTLVSAPRGMLIAYANQPGATAPDGDGAYSIYAGALNGVMREPGHSLDDIFKLTRLQVAEATQGAQIPWTASALITDAQLFPAAPAPSAAARPTHSAPPRVVLAAPPPPKRVAALPRDQAYRVAVTEDSLPYYQAFVTAHPKDPATPDFWVIIESRREQILWARALASDSAHGYWAYLRRFPDGPHTAEAEERLGAIQAALEPPPDYRPGPPELPEGYVDEGFDVPEIYPSDAPPPPPVFGFGAIQRVDPPDYLPPSPLGFLAAVVPAFLPRPPQDFVDHRHAYVPPPTLPPPPRDNGGNQTTVIVNVHNQDGPQAGNPTRPDGSPRNPNIIKPTLKPAGAPAGPKPVVAVPPTANPTAGAPPQPQPNAPGKVAPPNGPGKVKLPPAVPPAVSGNAVPPTAASPSPQPAVPGKVALPPVGEPTPQPNGPGKVKLKPVDPALTQPSAPGKVTLPPVAQPTAQPNGAGKVKLRPSDPAASQPAVPGKVAPLPAAEPSPKPNGAGKVKPRPADPSTPQPAVPAKVALPPAAEPTPPPNGPGKGKPQAVNPPPRQQPAVPAKLNPPPIVAPSPQPKGQDRVKPQSIVKPAPRPIAPPQAASTPAHVAPPVHVAPQPQVAPPAPRAAAPPQAAQPAPTPGQHCADKNGKQVCK